MKLSTGESEYYALVKGGLVGLGLQALFEDFQVPISVVVESDATAAKGTVNRIGLGKARHIQTRYLWLQERVAMDHLKVTHVPGKRNRADMLTKSAPSVQMEETLRRSGYVSWLNAEGSAWISLAQAPLRETSPRGLLHQQGGVTNCCSIYAQYACTGCATLCFGSSKSPLRSRPRAE